MDLKNIHRNFIQLKRFPLFSVLIGLTLMSNAYAESLGRADIPSLINALKIDKPLEFCGERVPLETQHVRERLEKEIMLTLWNRPQVLLWLKRSARYFPHIENALKKADLPDDLKYVTVAESALRPHASSRKRATGFWQFMHQTGRRYGLLISSHIDERRNISTSTEAAVRYFRDLHEEFGSWTLAGAAFNMGENGVAAEIMEQGTRDYYSLRLPLETERYIFKILAIKMIFSDRERYGFHLSDGDYYPPMSFDRVVVDNAKEVPVRVAANASETDFKTIKYLNPEIRGHYLPPGSRSIRIPKKAAKDFDVRYRKLVKRFLNSKKSRIYVVKNGDNLSTIALKFDVPLAAIIIWNRLDLRRPIHPGDRLLISPQIIPEKPKK